MIFTSERLCINEIKKERNEEKRKRRKNVKKDNR